MWRSRRPMPVCSFCRSTVSSPFNGSCDPDATVTSPLTAFVFASKLPPTVSGQLIATPLADRDLQRVVGCEVPGQEQEARDGGSHPRRAMRIVDDIDSHLLATHATSGYLHRSSSASRLPASQTQLAPARQSVQPPTPIRSRLVSVPGGARPPRFITRRRSARNRHATGHVATADRLSASNESQSGFEQARNYRSAPARASKESQERV